MTEPKPNESSAHEQSRGAQPSSSTPAPPDQFSAENQIHTKLELSREPATATQGSGGNDGGDRRSSRRVRGVGAMGPRIRREEEPSPTPQTVEAAASAARTTGHRFDLMRYLRLRRKQ